MTYGMLGYEPDAEEIQKRDRERQVRDNLYLQDKDRYLREHRAYLKEQNIPHDAMSDDQILMDMGQLAKKYGTLQSPRNETLRRELTRISQLQDRESRSTLGYYPGVLSDGLVKGGYMTGGMVAGGGALMGDSVHEGIVEMGVDRDSSYLDATKKSNDYLRKKGGEWMQAAAEGGGPVKSLKNIYFPGQSKWDTFRNALDFMVSGVGEVAPTMIGIALGGAAGGAVAPVALKAAPKVVQKGVINAALKKQVRANGGTLSPTLASQANRKLLLDKDKAFAALGTEGQAVAKAYAQGWGNIAGAVAASGTMGMGEVYNELYPLTQLPENHPEYVDLHSAQQYSWAFGNAIGALDSVIPSVLGLKALRKFFPGKQTISQVDAMRADSYVKKSLIRAVGLGMVIEGTTEATQEFLNLASREFAKARKDAVANDRSINLSQPSTWVDGDRLDELGEDLGTAAREATPDRLGDDKFWRLLDAGALGLLGGGSAGGLFTAIDSYAPAEIFGKSTGTLKSRVAERDARAEAELGERIREKNLIRDELESRADRIFGKTKGMEDGDMVVLPNGQRGIFRKFTPISNRPGEMQGMATVDVLSEDGETAKTTSIGMDFVFPIEKSPISAANRRQALQQPIDQTEPTEAEKKKTKEFLAGEQVEEEEDTGAIDRFKQDAKGKVEEEDVEEGKAEGALESSKSLRETEVELDEQPGTKITKGDLGAYRALQDIYDSDLTTDRLIDGPISDGLKKNISTEAYNQWVSNYYDKAETQPSKADFIDAFRRAHKIIHPKGRPTKGDKVAEDTAQAAEQAKQDAQAKAEIREKEAKDKKELEARTARRVDLANKKYNQEGEKSVVRFDARTQRLAVSELEMDMDIAIGDWTVESIDEETGYVTLSSNVKGYTLREVDPRRVTKAKKIKKETPPRQKKSASSGKEVARHKKEEIEKQGSELESLPPLASGTYVIQFGTQKSVVEITDDSWGFPMGGGTTGPTADFSRPDTFGQLILKMGKDMSSLASVRYEDEYTFDASFDGVAFKYFLKETVVEPIPLQEGNLVWKYGKNSETALDEEQDHVQVRSITRLNKEMSEKEVRAAIAEGMSRKGLKARSLPPDNTKNTRAKSVAIISILHQDTGQVFVRSAGFTGSVSKGNQGVNIFNFKKSGSDFVSALPSAGHMDFSKLPEGFIPLDAIVFSAHPGRLSAKFNSIDEYEAWTVSLPEVEELKLDQLPHVEELIKQFNSKDEFSKTLQREIDLNFAIEVNEKGELLYKQDKNGNPVIHESVGAYIGTGGNRPLWHYIKIDEIEKQIGFGDNAPLAPVYEKIFNILTTPGRTAQELNDEGMAPFVAGLRIGVGDKNDLGQSQIDTRIVSLDEDSLEASSKALAKALVSALYKRTKRRYEIDNKSGKETLFKVSEDGNRQIENFSDDNDSTPDFDEDYDWDASNPVAAGKTVFFEGFTADQLKIVHQEAINFDATEKSSEEIIEHFSLNDLRGVPVVEFNKRPSLLSIIEMAANSDNQGSQVDQMINMSAESSDSSVQANTSNVVDVRPIAAFIKWVADTVEPQTIDQLIRASSQPTSQNADALFDLESKFYASKGIVVKNNFDNKKIIKEIELSDEQRENLSVAYSNVLNAIRSPENTIASLQEAFFAISDSFGDDGTSGFIALEDSQITNQKDFDQALDDVGISETTQEIFKMYVKDALKQALPDHRVTVINLMSEHLGNNTPKALTTMRDKIESILVETGAINSVSTAPGQKPDASMMLDQLPDTIDEVTDATIELDDNIARGLPYALSQGFKISDEQAQRNLATLQKFFPDSLPGAAMSAVALERIGKFINESDAEGAEFGKRLHEHLSNMLVARDGMGLPPIAFDISSISSRPGTITRGQFIASEGGVSPVVQINPNFYLGQDDIIGKPYPFTGDVESDILITVATHELWHGTMEEPLNVYEQEKARGEDSPLQETIDLIDEVIRAVANASQGTQYSSMFTGDYSMARREILNRAWNRRDFAEFLSTISVDPALRRKIDQNGEGFINNLLDALYAAYLKLLNALGIETEGTALRSLLDLSRQLDSIHQDLQANNDNYLNQVTDAQVEAIAAMSETPAVALYSKLVQVLSKPIETGGDSVDAVAISQRINQLTKGNPKKKIPGLIRQAMQEGDKEQAEEFKKELAELKKKQVKKTGFQLPEQAEAGKWPDLLIKAGVTRAELDATIGPLLDGKQIVTKTELAEVASIADQSKMIAEAYDISQTWSSYSDFRKRNIYQGKDGEYIEILTFAPQFAPLDRTKYLGIVNEEFGDVHKAELSIPYYNLDTMDKLKNLNLLSSYDLMRNAGFERGLFYEPEIVQQILIKTQYAPKKITKSLDSVLGSSDPALDEVTNGYIKLSLWKDASIGNEKMFITLSNTQIEEAAQRNQVGGVGEKFADEYKSPTAFIGTQQAMDMWVNEIEFIEDSADKLKKLFDRFPLIGPNYTQYKLGFVGLKGDWATAIDLIDKYKGESELNSSEFHKQIIDDAVNFKKSGSTAPQIEFLNESVIKLSMSILGSYVREGLETSGNGTMWYEGKTFKSAREILKDIYRDEHTNRLEQLQFIQDKNEADDKFEKQLENLNKEFGIFWEKFHTKFEYRVNTVFKIMGGETFDGETYYAPDVASYELNIFYDFQNIEINGNQGNGTLRDLLVFLDGKRIAKETLLELQESGEITENSLLYGWPSRLSRVIQERFGTENQNYFRILQTVSPQVELGRELASTINSIYADKTELMPVEHGSYTKDQVTRVVNKISQWAQRYSDSDLYISIPSDRSTAERLVRILQLKNLNAEISDSGFSAGEIEGTRILVKPPSDMQLWDTQIQFPTIEDRDELQARGLGEMGGSTHHSGSSKYLTRERSTNGVLDNDYDTNEQPNRHHLRVTFVDADGIKTAFIDESQSDIDQEAQQDIIGKFDKMYSNAQNDQYQVSGHNYEYSYDLDDTDFLRLHEYNEGEEYKKGDVVVDEQGIFVAQTDTQERPTDTIESGRLDPFKIWRMLGKRKSGVERGYGLSDRPNPNKLLEQMRDFYLLRNVDGMTVTGDPVDEYLLVHIQPELIAYHDANQPSEGFEQNAGLEVYDIPDSPFRGVRILEGRNKEGKMLEYYGEEMRQSPGWNPENLHAGEIAEKIISKIKAYGGFTGAIPQGGNFHSLAKLKKALIDEFQKPVRGGQTIFKKNVELAALKFLLREMAKRNVNRIAFTRGDVIYPIVSGTPSNIQSAAKIGVLKSQGIQQAYIRTAQTYAKYFGLPLEQIKRSVKTKIDEASVKTSTRELLQVYTGAGENILEAPSHDTDVSQVPTGESREIMLRHLDATDPATVALFRDGIVELTHELTESGHGGGGAVFALDPNNLVAVQNLADDNEVFLFNSERLRLFQLRDRLWESAIGEYALGEGADPDIQRLRTEGRSTLNSVERLEILPENKAKLLEVARQASFMSRRQRMLFRYLFGESRLSLSTSVQSNYTLLEVIGSFRHSFRILEGNMNIGLSRVFKKDGKYYELRAGQTFDPDDDDNQAFRDPPAGKIQITGLNEGLGSPDENGMFQEDDSYIYFINPQFGSKLVDTPQGTKGVVLPSDTTELAEEEWRRPSVSINEIKKFSDIDILANLFGINQTKSIAPLFHEGGTYASESEALAAFDKKFSVFNKEEVYEKGRETSESEMELLYSDYYKNKYGQRPSSDRRQKFYLASLEEKKIEWEKITGPTNNAQSRKVEETNFMPVLLEYHGSYIMYALDLQARKKLEDLNQLFDKTYSRMSEEGVSNALEKVSKQPIGEYGAFGLPKAVELLFYDSTNDNFTITPYGSYAGGDSEMGRPVLTDSFRSELADGSTDLFDALKHPDVLTAKDYHGNKQRFPMVTASVELTGEGGTFVKDNTPKIYEGSKTEDEILVPKRRIHPIMGTTGMPVMSAGLDQAYKRSDESEMYSGIAQEWEGTRLDLIAEEQDSLDDTIRVLMQDDAILNSLERLVKTGDTGKTQDFNYIDIPQERLIQNLTQGERYLMADEIKGARENTRTHVTINKQAGSYVIKDGIISEGTEGVEVNETVFKVEGLPDGDEFLTENMIKQGLVRLKSTPSRVGVLVMNENGTPLTKEGHSLFREGSFKSWVSNQDLEAYDKTDVAQMSDQMDFIFDGREDNRGKYIVIENGSSGLRKGDVIQRNEANKYSGSGVLLRKYDEYLKEQEEAKNLETREDPPDISVKKTPIRNNEDLVKLITADYVWGHDDYNQYFLIAREVHRLTGIHINRILREIDSINNLFDLTPYEYRDKFKAIAINQGRKIPPNKIAFYMQDPTVSNPNGLQGNVMPEQNSVAIGQMSAAALNESSIAPASSMQEIRILLGNEKLSVEEMWKKYLKGKSPTKQMKKLVKNYGDSMQTETIAKHRNNDNIRDEARKRANNMVERQINHILYSQAEIKDQLDPTNPRSILSKITELQQKTILDEAHLFDRSKHGDRVRQSIDARVSSTQQELIDETEGETTDIILKAYKAITGRTETSQEFRDALQAVESHKKSSISADFISDLILEVSKMTNIDKLDAQALYNIISPRMNNEGKAIILSAVLNTHKDLILFAKVSQSRDINGRRSLLTKMQDLSNSTLGELKVLVSPKSRGFFPLGGAVEQEVQMQYANDRISLLEAELQRDKAILDNRVYDVLFRNYDEVAKRLSYLLGHNPANQVSNGTMFPVMTALKEGGYGMTEIEVQLNNRMQFENFEELKEAVLMNKDYLKNAPPEAVGSPEYNYVKKMTKNVEILPIWKLHNEQGGRFRLWSIKSARERFGEMGVRGRNLERMILQFENAVKAERPNVARLAREWNYAFDQARKNWGFKHGHIFMEQIVSPIIKWNEDQPQMSGDKKAFQKGAYKYARNLVNTDQDERILRDTLFKLFDEYEKSADYHRELAQRYGLKVRDEKSPVRDMLGRPHPDLNKKRRKNKEAYGDYLFRDPIQRGYLTVPRVLKSNTVQMILDEMPKYGWSQDAVDTESPMRFSWEKLATAMKNKELSQEAKEGELEVAVQELLGDDDMVLDMFITPYIKNTSPRELFNQPDPELKIPRSSLMEAWDVASQKDDKFEKFEMWVDVLYEDLKHKEDRSDYVDFKYGILKKLRNRYRQLSRSIEDYGKQSLEGGITLAGHLMDSRAQDAIIPQEFLSYTAYDEVTSGALLARTMQNAFFGRNAETLKGEMQELFKELSDKHTLLNDLASRVGSVKNPHGIPKFTKSQNINAEIEAERLENIPGKTGKEKLKNLKNSVTQLKNLVGRPKLGLNGAMQHVEAYFNSDLGPFKDEAMFWELLGLNSYFVLNQPKSGLTNLMSLFDFTMKYGGAGKSSATAVMNAWQNVGAEVFSGIMANMGVDSANIPLVNRVLGTHQYADELMDIFFMTSENDVGARKNLLDVGSGGVKRASKAQLFKHGWLRPAKNALNYDSLRGLKVTNVDGKRKYAPISKRTMLLKPFSYVGTLANHSIAVATARRVDAYVREVARHIESVNETQIKNGMPLLPEDHQVTSDELGKKGTEKRLFDILDNDMSYYGTGTISNLARDYLERRKSGDKRVLTKDTIIAIGHMGVNETAMEGGFATKPGAFSSTFYGRIFAPLQSWALKKVNQANNSVRSEQTGEVEAMALARMIGTVVAVSIPLGMAYSFWSDEYDEKLIGKGSPLRPAPKTTMIPFFGLFIGNPKENAKAMLERVARAGNVGGMALDFVNTAYNYADPYSYNRGFSLDSRMLLMSQATNAVKAVGNFIHMGGRFDWANVGRPLAYSMGANGPLQHYNMMAHLLDIDSEERRITRQVGNRHKIRAALNVLDIERRPMVAGGMPKTAFSAAIRTMERAAEADDATGFNEAYAEAIEYAIERGDEDPEKAVLNAFKRRNYRQGIARYKLSDEEWNNILSLYTEKQSRPLRYAMEQHEKYVNILNASTSTKAKKKSKPPLNMKPATYEELIKRSLSY